MREKPQLLIPCAGLFPRTAGPSLGAIFIKETGQKVYLVYVSPQFNDGVIATPTLEVQKGGLREVEWLSQYHTASEWKIRESKPSLSNSSPMSFTGAQEHRYRGSPGTGGSIPAVERKEMLA